MERKERENEGRTQDPAQLAQYLIEWVSLPRMRQSEPRSSWSLQVFIASLHGGSSRPPESSTYIWVHHTRKLLHKISSPMAFFRLILSNLQTYLRSSTPGLYELGMRIWHARFLADEAPITAISRLASGYSLIFCLHIWLYHCRLCKTLIRYGSTAAFYRVPTSGINTRDTSSLL